MTATFRSTQVFTPYITAQERLHTAGLNWARLYPIILNNGLTAGAGDFHSTEVANFPLQRVATPPRTDRIWNTPKQRWRKARELLCEMFHSLKIHLFVASSESLEPDRRKMLDWILQTGTKNGSKDVGWCYQQITAPQSHTHRKPKINPGQN